MSKPLDHLVDRIATVLGYITPKWEIRVWPKIGHVDVLTPDILLSTETRFTIRNLTVAGNANKVSISYLDKETIGSLRSAYRQGPPEGK